MSTIYFDCETFPITEEEPVPRLVCLQWAQDGGDPSILVGGGEGVHETVMGWLDGGHTAVAHNGFYDWSILEKWARIPHTAIWDAFESGRLRDTLVLAKLHAIEYNWMKANPNDGFRPADFSLAGLARGLLDGRKVEKGADTWRLRYGELVDVPPDEWPPAAREYALNDVVVLRDVYRAIVDSGWGSPDEARQTIAFWVLRLMEIWGITTSPPAVARLSALIEPARQAAQEHLLRVGILRPGTRKVDTARRDRAIEKAGGAGVERTATGRPSSRADYMIRLGLDPSREAWLSEPSPPTKDTKEVKRRVEAWCRERGVEPERTDTGEISTDRSILEVIGETGDEDLAMLAAVGAAEKIATTYMPVFSRPHLHPYWNGLVETGRVSVSRPNLNNIPRELRIGKEKHPIVRQVFVARPGYAFVDADYTQAELCSLAQVCYEKFGYSVMRDVIISGRDLHSWIGASLGGMVYDTFLERLKEKDREIKDLRQLAKCANFGLPGGLGPKKFVDFARDTYGVVFSLDRAQEVKAEWLEAFPEIRQMFSWTNDQLRFAPDFTLEQHRSGRRRGGCGYCDGNNSLFQGLTADGAKRALVLVAKECYLDPSSPLWGSRPVAFIYDEILLEVPEGRVGVAAERLVALMKEGMAWATPDVPAACTAEAMYHWTKDARRTVGRDGLLIPFDERMV